MMTPKRPGHSHAAMSLRALNRALLARQLLLTRENMKAARAIEQLVGMQAQQAKPPFVGLWSRIAGFKREDLVQPLVAREIVRVTAMRATLHLMSATDYVRLRPALHAMLLKGMEEILKARGAGGIDVPRIVGAARRHLATRAQTFAELRLALANEFPGVDERAMGYAVRTHLPLVQVPTDAEWGFPGAAAFAPAEQWLGRPIGGKADLEHLVLRYLGAFGPATAADVQAWSAVTGIGEILERLRSKLLVFQDEKGRELFDLPKAPRPDEDTGAPVRFVPEYDNLVLAHADRSRIVADRDRHRLVTKNLQVKATFLVDGFVAGTWKIERKRATATVTVEPFAPLKKAARAELEREGLELLEFVEPDAKAHEVTFGKPVAS